MRGFQTVIAGISALMLIGAGYQGFGAGSVPPEVVASFAPPPLPPELSSRVQRLLDVRSIQGAVLLSGPESSREPPPLIAEWSVTGSSQLWRVGGSGVPTQLTAGTDSARLFALSRDGSEIFFTRDAGGREYPGLYRMPATGGAPQEIRAQAGVQVRPHALSRDGKYLYFSANDQRPDAYAVYRYDLAARTSERLPLPEGLWAAGGERDGRLLLELERGSQWSEWSLWAPDLQPAPIPLVGQGDRGDFAVGWDLSAPVAQGGDPVRLLVTTDRWSGYRAAYRVEVATGPDAGRERSRQVIHDGLPEVEGISQDEAGTRLILHLNDGGRVRPEALDSRTLAPIALPGLPTGDTVYFGGTTQDGRWSLVFFESSDRPMSIGVWDWRRRRYAERAAGSAPELDLSAVPPATIESYPARDGTPIPLIVRRPPGCAPGEGEGPPCPVVAIFHGGPEGQARPRFSPILQAWIEAGYVVAMPNVRGSTGYGYAWAHADDGAARLSVITDIEDFSKHARQAWARGGIAPFVAVMGNSYGGYSALMAMTRFAGAYDAGVSTVGISDLESFLANTAPYRRALRVNEYGDPAEIPDVLRQLSPIRWADRARDPLLILQGLNDPRVPAGEAIQMYDAYRSHAPAELILLPEQGHGAADRAGQAAIYSHQLRFIEAQRQAYAARPRP